MPVKHKCQLISSWLHSIHLCHLHNHVIILITLTFWNKFSFSNPCCLGMFFCQFGGKSNLKFCLVYLKAINFKLNCISKNSHQRNILIYSVICFQMQININCLWFSSAVVTISIGTFDSGRDVHLLSSFSALPFLTHCTIFSLRQIMQPYNKIKIQSISLEVRLRFCLHRF